MLTLYLYTIRFLPRFHVIEIHPCGAYWKKKKKKKTWIFLFTFLRILSNNMHSLSGPHQYAIALVLWQGRQLVSHDESWQDLSWLLRKEDLRFQQMRSHFPQLSPFIPFVIESTFIKIKEALSWTYGAIKRFNELSSVHPKKRETILFYFFGF